MGTAREFACFGHDVLFDDERTPPAECDVCGERVADDEAGPPGADDAPHAVSGRGVYLWARGEEIRRDEVPLCPSCAAALGLTALARWEIEEEEG